MFFWGKGLLFNSCNYNSFSNFHRLLKSHFISHGQHKTLLLTPAVFPFLSSNYLIHKHNTRDCHVSLCRDMNCCGTVKCLEFGIVRTVCPISYSSIKWNEISAASWWVSTRAFCSTCCAWRWLWSVLQIQKGNKGMSFGAFKLFSALKSGEGLPPCCCSYLLPLFPPSKDDAQRFLFFWEWLLCPWTGQVKTPAFFPPSQTFEWTSRSSVFEGKENDT